MATVKADIGYKNNLRGRQTEAVVKGYHIAARQLGVANIVKLATPTVSNKSGKLIYSAKSTVDFVGFMLDGTGRFVAEEVKSFFEPPRFQMSKVAEHQRAYLDSVLEAKGVAVLTIVDRQWKVFVCPWAEVRERTSLTHDDIRVWACRPQMYLKPFVTA